MVFMISLCNNVLVACKVVKTNMTRPFCVEHCVGIHLGILATFINTDEKKKKKKKHSGCPHYV